MVRYCDWTAKCNAFLGEYVNLENSVALLLGAIVLIGMKYEL